MRANGEPEVGRRNFLRLAFTSLAWATGPPSADGTDVAEVPAIGARVRAMADQAPLAMQFQGSTADELRRWQSGFSAKLRSLLGPHRPPARWDSALERSVTLDDHVREERVLSAEGVAPLPLHLLLPRDTHPVGPQARRPAVVALHGHGEFGHDSVVGRDETPVRRDEIARNRYDYALQLVRRGYVVVAPCLTPFGRRRGELGRAPRGVDACAQTFMALQALGRLLIAENLRDVLWALDFVADHEAVDADRLGCVGLSYGGRMTMLAAAVEPRVRVAVVSGALNCLQERVATGHASGCQTIPALLAFGDVPEIASLIAPRPCLWEVGSRDDLIAPEWADAALSRLRRAYRAAGAEGELRVDRFDGGHQWHGVAAYPLLDAVLKLENRSR
jgi:dienelactone hydrolase